MPMRFEVGRRAATSPDSAAGSGTLPANALPTMSLARATRERTTVDAKRRCRVCDWEEQVTEPEETDVLGPPCSRCSAPSERVAVLAWRVERIPRNPNAFALGRLGASRGGLARAAALTAKRRREIAR